MPNSKRQNSIQILRQINSQFHWETDGESWQKVDVARRPDKTFTIKQNIIQRTKMLYAEDVNSQDLRNQPAKINGRVPLARWTDWPLIRVNKRDTKVDQFGSLVRPKSAIYIDQIWQTPY